MAGEIVVKVFRISNSTKEAKEIRMFEADQKTRNSFGDFWKKVATLFSCESIIPPIELFWKGRLKLINFGSF